ncbi:MAG: [LysW]-aminoadipate kinase [Candidatus Micrarchaeota archaeon]
MLVVKIGGSIFSEIARLADDLASLSGTGVIVVHGGAAETTRVAEKMGKEQRFITSASGFKSRYTDRETMEIFEMVVAGKINKELVAALRKKGVNALGLCGVDGGLLRASKKILKAVGEDGKEKIIRDDYTGKIESVNTELLRVLVNNGYVPVIAPLALSQEFELLNTDGDRAAAMLARSVGAEKLVMLTDVDGYYENFPDGLVREMRAADLHAHIQKATGGMKRKLLAAKEAIEGGVREAVIANGKKEKPITSALAGNGTVIR